MLLVIAHAKGSRSTGPIADLPQPDLQGGKKRLGNWMLSRINCDFARCVAPGFLGMDRSHAAHAWEA